jgi:prophage maintenance system killer protein
MPARPDPETCMLVYLSVHDIVWINSTVTGETLPFDYELLEAAMAAQYSYGDSTDVSGQAANFLASFVLKPPFAYGNLRSAYVAVTAFLNANGFALQVGDAEAAQLIRGLASGEATAAETVEKLAKQAQIGLRPGVTLRALVTYICNEHTETLALLKEVDE